MRPKYDIQTGLWCIFSRHYDYTLSHSGTDSWGEPNYLSCVIHAPTWCIVSYNSFSPKISTRACNASYNIRIILTCFLWLVTGWFYSCWSTRIFWHGFWLSGGCAASQSDARFENHCKLTWISTSECLSNRATSMSQGQSFYCNSSIGTILKNVGK